MTVGFRLPSDLALKLAVAAERERLEHRAYKDELEILAGAARENLNRVLRRIFRWIDQQLAAGDTDYNTLISRAASRFEDELEDVLEEDIGFAAAVGYERIVDHVQRAGREIHVASSFDEAPRTVLDDVEDMVFEASERTMGKLHGDFNLELQRAIDDGLGVRDIRERLRGVFDRLQTWELDRIARTETHRAHNRVAGRIIGEADLEYKQWIAAVDGRTRETHEALNGEIAIVGGRFSNGLRWPGDAEGPLEETVNCRCRLVPFMMPEDMRAPDRDQFRVRDLVPLHPAIEGEPPYTEEEVSDFIAAHQNDFDDVRRTLEQMGEERNAVAVQARLKKTDSLMKKLSLEGADPIEDITDAAGTRMVLQTESDVHAVAHELREKYGTPIKDRNYYERPQGGYYRAQHLVVEGPSGRPVEIQLSTPEDRLVAGIAHDAIYKGNLAEQQEEGIAGRLAGLASEVRGVDDHRLQRLEKQIEGEDIAPRIHEDGRGRLVPQMGVSRETQGLLDQINRLLS